MPTSRLCASLLSLHALFALLPAQSNPGFEEGEIGTLPTGWFGPAGYEVVVSDEEAFAGEHCVRVSSTDADKESRMSRACSTRRTGPGPACERPLLRPVRRTESTSSISGSRTDRRVSGLSATPTDIPSSCIVSAVCAG